MNSPYWEIARRFFRLGAVGFGGPLATMAMMEQEFSRKEGWVTIERFGRIYALCKLLPGPVSTQLAIFLGRERGGTVGGILAGVCFIFPSFLLVLALSAIYSRSAGASQVQPLLSGLQVGALAVVALSAHQLGGRYWRIPRALGWMVAGGALTYFFPAWEAANILGIGLLNWMLLRFARSRAYEGVSPLLMLAWICFKSGAFVFGTGLAIVPLLQADVVDRMGWLSPQAFMDGIAIGQITPGPVTITSTFIGYHVAGFAGALVATAAMFLPSFINILLIVPRFWRKIGESHGMADFVDGAIPAVVGGIVATAIQLGQSSIQAPIHAVIFALALVANWRGRVPAYLVIPAAGIATGLSQLIR